MRDILWRRHYSNRIERCYCEWVKRYANHFNMKSRDYLCNGECTIELFNLDLTTTIVEPCKRILLTWSWGKAFCIFKRFVH